MMEHPFLAAAIGAVVAGFVQGLSGFAFSMVAMSFWAWWLDPMMAAVLAVFGGLTGQIIGAVSVRRGFDAKLLLPFLAGGFAGIPLGVYLLPLLDVHLFKAALGGLLIVWCPFMLLAPRLPAITGGGRVADGLAGLAGGICGGIGGFTGALPTLWCSLRKMPKDTQRSVIQNFNLATLAATMVAYVVTGKVTRDMLPMFAVVAPAMLVPGLLGARVYVGLSEDTFRKIVLVLLAASGAALLASGVPRL